MRRTHFLAILLAAALLIPACGGNNSTATPTTPTPSPTTPAPAPTPPPTTPTPPAPPPTPPPVPVAPNTPPTVTLAANTRHIEMLSDATFTATVTDAETPIDQLTYEWSAPAGTFSGSSALTPSFTGPVVRKWRSPREDRTPVFYTITVRVIENYVGQNGPAQNVATATYRIAVNNSPKELADLAGQFIIDFADSTTSAEYCVRNFSDTCRGRAREIDDIRTNRSRYTILSLDWTITKVDIDYPRDIATVEIRSTFTSRVRSSGAIEIARGDNLITGILINDRWYLCESAWRPIGRDTQFLR